jgi:hypothetical protein
MRFCPMPIHGLATTVSVKPECPVLVVAEAEISLAAVEALAISSNHFSVAVLLDNSEVRQVRRVGKI